MDRENIIPENKHDISVIKNIEKASKKDIEQFLPELFEWIKDINWPVAPKLAEILVNFDELIIPFLKNIIKNPDSVDELSFYYIMLPLLNETQILLLINDLEIIVEKPTKLEKELEYDILIQEFLQKNFYNKNV